MARHISLLFAAILLIAAPGRARAQDAAAKQKAARLLDQGVGKYESGDYNAALDKFQAAYAAFPSPKILLNLGEALRKLGRDVEAADAYSRYLSETPAGEIREEKRKLAQDGLAELQPRLGRLRIDAPQPGAQLTLDGKAFKPPADRPAWVLPGSHSIGAQAPAFEPKTMWVEVHAGEEKHVAVALEMAGAPTEKSQKPVEPTPTPVPVTPANPPTSDLGTQTSHNGRVWTWVAAGAAGAMLVVGILEGSAASSDYDEYKTTRDPLRYDQLRNDIGSESTIANVMFIGAGVAAVGAGFLYWWEGREDSGHVAVAPSVGMQQVGLTVQGRF